MLRINDIILMGVVFSAMAAGILLPAAGAVFQPVAAVLMMVLLFLSFLSTELADIGRRLRARLLLVGWLAFLKLVGLPAGIYAVLRFLLPEYAVAGLVLSGTSTAVIAPFISGLVAADTSLVLIMSVLSSLLVPFTLPLLVEAVAGHAVDIPLAGMIRLLALVVFVPVAAKEVLGRLCPRVLAAAARIRFPLSLPCMAMITMGMFSRYAEYFTENPAAILEATLIDMGLAAFIFIAGLGASWRSPLQEQAASVISLGNINNFLIIVFAGEFFGPLGPTLAAMYVVPFFGLIFPLRAYLEIRRRWERAGRGGPGRGSGRQAGIRQRGG